MLHTLQSSRQSTQRRQASLIGAAVQLAAERSPATITTGDLARAIGITQGAVFRHFPSKEAIWLEVIAWVTDHLMARLHLAASSANVESPEFNPLAALQAVFIAHVSFVTDHPGVPRIIFHELQNAQDSALKQAVRDLMNQHRRLVTELLRCAKIKGLLAPDTDLPGAAVLFLGVIQGLVMQSLLSGQVQAIAAQAPGVFTLYIRSITTKEST